MAGEKKNIHITRNNSKNKFERKDQIHFSRISFLYTYAGINIYQLMHFRLIMPLSALHLSFRLTHNTNVHHYTYLSKRIFNLSFHSVEVRLETVGFHYLWLHCSLFVTSQYHKYDSPINHFMTLASVQ